MKKKIKVYEGKDLVNLQSDEYIPLDVENTYLCWPVAGEGIDVNDRSRVAKAIKLSDVIERLIK